LAEAALNTILRRIRTSRTRYRALRTSISNLGLRSWVVFCVQRWRQTHAGRNALLTLTSKYARHPAQCRAHTSDLAVFRQIFVEREYRCLDDVAEASFIIDCGAYVGYSSAYFLSRFPRCDVVAIEPDPQNFELLKLNLAPYGNRVRTLRAAVWSHQTKLALSEVRFGDEDEWSREVRECSPDEDSDLLTVDIGSILNGSGHKRVSVLKVDIEGAEAVVFSKNYESWIDRVDNIVIEIHKHRSFSDCAEVFEKAIAGRGFSRTRCEELTVCKRLA
jgi:FkbM family methyltransferase